MTDTVQQLHELPDLAAECFATWGHPNPSERPVVAVKRIHPKAPADLDTLDALRADELGLLHRLAQCVRAVPGPRQSRTQPASAHSRRMDC